MTSINISPETDDWYVRRGSTVQGPYPARQIARYVLLGRIRLDDRISRNGDHWFVLAERPDLIPEEMGDLGSPEGRARFIAARNKADERNSADASNNQSNDAKAEPQLEHDRRDPLEQQDWLISTQQLTGHHKSTWREGVSHPVFVLGGGMMVALTLVLALAVWRNVEPINSATVADCNMAPGPGINWSQCAKNGSQLNSIDLRAAQLQNTLLHDSNFEATDLSFADMSYGEFQQSRFYAAKLRDVRLVGANLQGADFSHADLRGADLSYADLRDATLEKTQLGGARLTNAIWINGKPCLEASIGLCKQ